MYQALVTLTITNMNIEAIRWSNIFWSDVDVTNSGKSRHIPGLICNTSKLPVKYWFYNQIEILWTPKPEYRLIIYFATRSENVKSELPHSENKTQIPDRREQWMTNLCSQRMAQSLFLADGSTTCLHTSHRKLCLRCIPLYFEEETSLLL